MPTARHPMCVLRSSEIAKVSDPSTATTIPKCPRGSGIQESATSIPSSVTTCVLPAPEPNAPWSEDAQPADPSSQMYRKRTRPEGRSTTRRSAEDCGMLYISR